MVFCRNPAAGRGDKTELFVGGTGIRAFDCGGIWGYGYGISEKVSGDWAPKLVFRQQRADNTDGRLARTAYRGCKRGSETTNRKTTDRKTTFPNKSFFGEKETGKIYGDESPEGQA